MMSWQTILAIGSGGFIGAISRAYINGLINRNVPHDLPFGTLGVNILGSLILGILFALFTYTQFFSIPIKSFLSTGMMGALTTYSTFALETFWLLNQGSFVLGLANIILNVVATVLAAGSGFKVIEYFLR
ncbi:fluoride efflux transporter CrcB [Sulfurospirillum arcachonense]|uniref:fluoride efflux transporter CrcB n=1 Tax=Sulfurospirillum arcachonense TaxID=57666 RepID=UPI00316ABC4A